jgi:RNA polymerase sigma factor (sigma-70 family)
MAQISKAVQHVRQVAMGGLPDADLLGRFVEQRDEGAFTSLIQRHGPMVWGVCRRMLNHHDAEDVFQVVFLVLFRKAASVKPRKMVSNWLYGVAHQAALQARRTAARRNTREKQVAMLEPAAVDTRDDLRGVLDVELSRLPDRYRSVIVLCELEGMTRQEAARELSCPEGTVAGRLARARAMLAKRLTKRGITLSVGVLAAQAQEASASLAPLTVKSIFTGQAVSAEVASLIEGVLRTMLIARIKTVTVLVGAAIIGLAGLVCYSTTADDQAKPFQQEAGKKAGKDLQALQGTWYVTEMEEGGQPQPRARFEDVKMRLVINGDQLAIMTTTPDVRDVGQQGMTVTLDEKASPKHLNASKDGNTILGIYAFDQGRLKICVDLRGASRPESFKTENGSHQRSYVLRQKDAKAK